MTMRAFRCFQSLALALLCAAPAGLAASPVAAGAAKIDITPELPIRLTGYESRPAEATRIEQRLFARALAIGADGQPPVVLIIAELLGIPESLGDAVAAELQRRHGIDRVQIVVSATHTHTAPALTGLAPYLFSRDLPADEAAHIDGYTEVLKGKLVQVAGQALARRQPARLAWGEGSAGFSMNRRKITNGKWSGFGPNPDGPVDHTLPLLRVTDAKGQILALFASYACHCTTLTGNHNFVHPDWAGDAAARVEASYQNAVVLIGAGCGADADPLPRGALEHVALHGGTIAAEIQRLLATELRPLAFPPQAMYRRIELDLDRAVGRDELQQRVADPKRKAHAFYASKLLQQVDAGQPIPTRVPYPVQAWAFGPDLAMVFLSGEVVSEYSLRLRRELTAGRCWVNAYANSAPCYVASERMLAEGGYEVDSSMDYYGWPTRLATGTEDRIVGAVRDLLPAFRRDPATGGSAPVDDAARRRP